MAELYQLQEQEIPEAMGQLQDSHLNLKKVADYCEGLYIQVVFCREISSRLLISLARLDFTFRHMITGRSE